MSRDQRVADNPALLRSREYAGNYPLLVLFNLRKITNKTYNPQHYNFMLNGLKEVEKDLRSLNIPFDIVINFSNTQLVKYLKELNCNKLIKDFSPLKGSRKDNIDLNDKLKEAGIGFEIIDAHNIIPVNIIADKSIYAFRSFKKKMNELLPSFLVEPYKVKKMDNNNSNDIIKRNIDWDKIYKEFDLDPKDINPYYPKSGSHQALKTLDDFINNRLDRYDLYRNDPNKDALSNLSPYLHFGQISPLRVALEVKKYQDKNNISSSFLDELISWRELAENFTYYNPNYDNFKGFPSWAQKSLLAHIDDKREYIYTLGQFEGSKTHDPLWNSAQVQMRRTGKMHGYLRMYWAKKILEWTPDPYTALDISIYLNDKYSLDGRDPNGYAGIAWAIGGVHDRPWFNRDIFGMIRYMSYNGLRKKFDVDTYILNNRI